MIGIDISDQTIKIVQLSNGKSKRLISNCMYILPSGVLVNGVIANQQLMEESLRAALISCSIKGGTKDTVVLSIPETQSFLSVIEMPDITDDEVNEAIRWEIAQHIPFSVDSVYIDWQPLSLVGHTVPDGRREIQVGAAQKKVVDPLYELMMDIDLDVAAFELESQAIVRSLISKELHSKQGILIVDIGSTSTNVIIHDVGASRFTASLRQGVVHLATKLTPNDQQQLMRNLQEIPPDLLERITPIMAPEIDKLVLDIKGVADFYNGIDTQHTVKEVILTGGGSNLAGLDAVFMNHFGDITIARGNPWVNILSSADSANPVMSVQESARYATALGLALRNVIAL